MTFDEWWAQHDPDGLSYSGDRALALAAWNVAVERCAKIAERYADPEVIAAVIREGKS